MLCQRHQLSGLCYIHGPVVLQHYLVWLSQDLDTNPGMIDMSNMVRKTFDADRLEEHIFKDKGGSSRHMLGHILLPEFVVISHTIDNVTHELLEYLEPALVSEFQVHYNFLDRKRFIYTGKPAGALKGLQATVLIGTRVDSKLSHCFLLQNWWETKQFMEVDIHFHKLLSFPPILPNLSTRLTPLYALLQKHTTWKWSTKCQEAFEEVKALITSEQVLTHFNPELPL